MGLFLLDSRTSAGDGVEGRHPAGAEHDLRATLAEHPRCRFSPIPACWHP